MKGNYKRRSDWQDLSREIQLIILDAELDLAETEEERTSTLTAIKRLKEVIERLTPKPAPPGGMEKNPGHDLYNLSWR